MSAREKIVRQIAALQAQLKEMDAIPVPEIAKPPKKSDARDVVLGQRHTEQLTIGERWKLMEDIEERIALSKAS